MILTALWLIPLLGAVLVNLLPKRLARGAGLAVGIVVLGLGIWIINQFIPSYQGYQFEENFGWIPQFGISYHLGIDGISLWLVLLNIFLTVIAIAASGKIPRQRGFIALLLLQAGAMTGLFLAADLVLFYIFWEAMLIPAYFLLFLWGEGPRPAQAAIKFVLYTLAGSLLMLVGVIGEYLFAGGAHHSFDLARLAAHPPSPEIQFGLFLLFGLAFAIKVPIFPLHGWLAEAYASAPVAYLVLFAGVMGKTGAYAMLRVLTPLLPHPIFWWNWNEVVPILAVLGIIWGGLLALLQRDMKLVITYSSLSHMGFVVLGIFSFTQIGQQGAVLQMINHGIIIPALFLIVAWIAERAGSRDRSALSKLAPRMPVMAGIFLVITLAALGLPGLNSFVGEFLTLLGAWQLSPWLALAGCIGLVLAPIYMLRLFQGLMYVGKGENPSPGHPPKWLSEVAKLPDLSGFEAAVILPLVGLMFLFGLYPGILTIAMTALGYPLSIPWS